jgi:pimeloyl-ACP methyl ester carboxylesterase
VRPPGRSVDGVHYVVLPGAGSAGPPWATAAGQLDAAVLPVPDEPDVTAMAAALEPSIATVPRPRVIVGTSLGAMVALELARRIEVDGLVLIAAGFGISVGEPVLDWVASNPPDLMEKMARIGLADRRNRELAEVRLADFASRGQPLLLNHLRALAAYRPEPLERPPPTVVLWGEHDRGVPLADHAELALRCGGLLVPIRGAGHAPFLERPCETVAWIRATAGRAALTTRTGCSRAASLDTRPISADPFR